jgi:hypothetical protein
MIRVHTRLTFAVLAIAVVGTACGTHPRPVPPSAAAPASSPADSDRYLASTRTSLRLLFERTGGFAIVEDGLLEGLRRINGMMRK